MIKIIEESIQDVESFLKNDAKGFLKERIPSSVSNPEEVGDQEVCDIIVDEMNNRFPDERLPDIVSVAVVKVQGEETEILTSDHKVIKYNGYLYDFTAHQFTDEYNNLLTFGQIPVIQSAIKNDSQINDRVSTVKSYALLEY